MEHDPFFKGLLKSFFGEFLRLFYPAQASRLNLSRVRFLDKEEFTDVLRGRAWQGQLAGRRLDLVAEVRTRAGARPSWSWSTWRWSRARPVRAFAGFGSCRARSRPGSRRDLRPRAN